MVQLRKKTADTRTFLERAFALKRLLQSTGVPLIINGASSLGLEKERGSIKVGKYADFVVLDQDILELEKTDKTAIFNTNVSNTWFEGKEVYSSK